MSPARLPKMSATEQQLRAIGGWSLE